MSNQEADRESQGTGAQRSAQAGKGRERLEVSSGFVLVIDQFMLANEQFLALVEENQAEKDVQGKGLREAVERYGGCLLALQQGEYRVFRDPQQTLIALSPNADFSASEAELSSEQATGGDADFFDFEPVLNAKGNLSPRHHVFVDTRCLVFVDADFLSDQESLSQYRELRKKKQDKQARDLLREYGGAVRYGFNRYGDELGVFEIPDEGLIALWPDVIE